MDYIYLLIAAIVLALVGVFIYIKKIKKHLHQ